MSPFATARAAPLLLALALPGLASAQLLVYEPFDYAAGTTLDGTPATGANLTGSYVDTTSPSFLKLRIDSPGLDYGSLVGAPAPTGNRLNQFQGTTAASASVSVDTDVRVDPGSTIFFSALFTLDDSTNGNRRASIALTDGDNGDEITFGETAVGVRAIRITAETAAIGGSISDGADLAFDNGQTLYMIGRYANSSTAGADRLDLVGYDTAAAITLPTAFDPADPNAQFAFALANTNIDLAKITSVTFTIRGTANNFIDELRIGESYAVVAVPEPETVLLMVVGLALAALIIGRRRVLLGHRAAA